mgnify:CR=1 FL=1
MTATSARKAWGDAGYAARNLVAELGAEFLVRDLELRPDVSEDHAAYFAQWLRVLKQDSRAIFSAAAGIRLPARTTAPTDAGARRRSGALDANGPRTIARPRAAR